MKKMKKKKMKKKEMMKICRQHYSSYEHMDTRGLMRMLATELR